MIKSIVAARQQKKIADNIIMQCTPPPPRPIWLNFALNLEKEERSSGSGHFHK